jgi:hypothetical protein
VQLALGASTAFGSHQPSDAYRGAVGRLSLWTFAISPAEVMADASDKSAYRQPQLLYLFDEGAGSTAANAGTAGRAFDLRLGRSSSGLSVFQVRGAMHEYSQPVWLLPDEQSLLGDVHPRVALPLPVCTRRGVTTCTSSPFVQTVVEDTPTTVMLIGESDLGEPTQAVVTQPPDPSAGWLYQTTACCDPSGRRGPPLSAGATVTSPDDALIFVPAPGVFGDVGNFSFRVHDASGRPSTEASVLLRVLVGSFSAPSVGLTQASQPNFASEERIPSGRFRSRERTSQRSLQGSPALLASGVTCAPGQRRIGSLCEACPEFSYEKNGECIPCVSLEARTHSFAPIDGAGATLLCARIEFAQPDGVICISGTHLTTWALEPGRWRISRESSDIRACEKEESDAVNSRCIGGTISAQDDPDDLCTEGHTGPMCRLCVINGSTDDAYFDTTRSRCSDCPSDRESWMRVIALACGLAGLAVLFYLFQCSWLHDSEAVVYICVRRKEIMRRCCRGKLKCGVQRATFLFSRAFFYATVFVETFQRAAVPRFKIVITCYQVLVALPDVYGVDMPSEYCESSPPWHTPLPIFADAHRLRAFRPMARLALCAGVRLVHLGHTWRLSRGRAQVSNAVARTHVGDSRVGPARTQHRAVSDLVLLC